ncbi:DNA ligase (NAD+) [Natranaerovirga hydrolytica]|uniref:DNA ligase n=1 Tax=Natranaerovirga hydrolytica TaxID=680378 RepID=A0A4R1MK28_9FIRM|nr:NAD-dependent DNA ligase LigA [Natranaerovirga hydrolytica]TCK92887.1 DNA ligase (NAD+) [Natranaerovirga hydrolytica]
MSQKPIERMKELIEQLNKANKAYYQENTEIMSNLEYDALYDELLRIEKEIGTTFSNSPTQKVGYELLSALPKEAHSYPMLSLDKTKDIGKLQEWLGDQKGLLSWKLDGLTIVLTYREGELYKAVTRGNGEIGEVVTNNAKVFKNLPIKIEYKKELVIRGEAVIKYKDFEYINDNMVNGEKYKNPRNLCSGSVRQLNNEITANRNVNLFVFQVVQAEDMDFKDSKENQLEWIQSLGFECVDYTSVTKDNIEETVHHFEENIIKNDFGSDGLVLTFDSINDSQNLGATSKFPRHSIAFKWADDIKETTLKEIKWNTSRTGLINPIAVFEPVELEGTTVSRASVHNVSILEALELGVGDTIEVYKANMIIPQIASNVTRSGLKDIPTECPVCEGETEIKRIKDVKVLYCTNEACGAKKIKELSHFVSRNAMNIEGLSEATLEKFIQKGFVNTYADIFRLSRYEKDIKEMEGFGEKSYNRLIKSIEKSRTVAPANFIYALGIANVGLSNAKLLCKHFNNDIEKLKKASVEELISIQGFGDILAQSIVQYFEDFKKKEALDEVLTYIELDMPKDLEQEALKDLTFVITGSLSTYENRDALKEKIEVLGGKVTGSVSKNTSYLINNDKDSTSSKNKKAKSLEIPIISEEEFNALMNGNVE